eukprot:s12947_g1.t1
MKAAYENTHGSVEEAFEPSDDYLAAKMEEFQNVEPTASPLNEAIKRAYQGSRPLVETLLEVAKDSQIKEQFFTSPIALQSHAGGKREWAADAPWEASKWSRNKGTPFTKGPGKDFKGGKKGSKGKGSGKKGDKSAYSLMSHTADGREICFAYNAQGCSGGCGRVHVCRVRGCNQPHPLWEHFAKIS